MIRNLAVLSAAAVVALWAAPAVAQGMMPGRMFGPRPALAAPSTAPALPVDQAIARARQYLNQFQNPDLVPAELIEFSNVFYVVIQERSTGKGAFALLVDRVNGNASPEMGPPMMWNIKYGRWIGGAGMMGSGMMGPGYGPGAQPGPGTQPSPGLGPRPGTPSPRPQTWVLDEARARAALTAWIAQAFPGAGIGKVVEFPGFFTFRLVRDGKTFALASVNAFGGQVWYAWHYGTVVQEQVIR